MVSGEWEIPVPFDVLDAAIEECLPGYAPGFVDFRREVITPGSVVYHLSQADLGDLGVIKIRKLGQDRSHLYVDDPPTPPLRHHTAEELQTFAALPDEERIAGIVRVDQARSAERDQLLARRREHQGQVIRGLFDRLTHDLAWRPAQARPAHLPEIPPHPLKERREKVRELKLAGQSRKDIAAQVHWLEDVVKKDLEWLTKGGYLPKL